MRWLAIHFPLLALESLAPAESAEPLAITELQGAQQRILVCNSLATELGVAAGMRIGAVRALSAGVRLVARDKQRELAALEAVATWSGTFTSQVSLDPPWGVLLELAGSLRLFGGIDPLLSRLEDGLQALDYRTRLCLAPTPAGAMLLARRDGPRRLVRDKAMLRRLLAEVPLRLLPLQPDRQRALQEIGLERLGDLLQLPMAGLERRLGSGFVRYLQRLLGDVPDPRARFQPPQRFQRRLELPAEVGSSPALLFAARRLLLELAGFLSARRSATQCLEWVLRHSDGGESRFQLRLMLPQHDPAILQSLLQERLEQLRLTAPVRELGLLVRVIEPMPERPLSLFREPGTATLEPLLLERLQARLGEDSLSRVQWVAEHRPERAWRKSAVMVDVSASLEGTTPPHLTHGLRRPLWLLPAPEPLRIKEGWPWWRGRLYLEPERERIESGWWDGEPVLRDYFIARAPGGEQLWIYRELQAARRWFLHGFF